MALSERFRKALGFAFDMHCEDLRKASGTPYLGHLLAVAAIVLDAGGNEETAIAALLHDSVEDHHTENLLQQIEHEFGQSVARLVSDASDSFSTPKRPWRERKEEHLMRVATTLDAELALVLGADKLHNLNSMLLEYEGQGRRLWQAFKSSPADQVWYYTNMVNLVEPLLPSHLASTLRHALAQFTAVALRP